MEGDEYAETRRYLDCVLVDYKLRSKLQKPSGLYMDGRQTTMGLGTKVRVKGNVLV